MKSRSEKYYDEEKPIYKSRTSRNTKLYKEISNSEINDFNIASNAKVIGENDSNYVNVDRLKEILEIWKVDIFQKVVFSIIHIL